MLRFLYRFFPIFLLALMGCGGEVPYSDRQALHLVPEAQMRAIGERSFTEIRSRSQISNNSAFLDQVRRVGQRVAKAVAGREAFEFFVFEDDQQVNAFVLPGGKVVVYTGLLRFIKSDDELAVVLGHEIAHVTARHANERLSHQIALGVLSSSLEIAMQGKGSHDTVLGALGVGSTLGVLLPFSRMHELEADRIGLIYAAKAGYDPAVALGFWERMQQASAGKKPPAFLSTHPSDKRRHDHMQTVCIPQAKSLRGTCAP